MSEIKQDEGYKGFVLKKSKFLGSVRKRLLVLDGDTLKSYKDEESDKPTESILLSQSCTATADMKGTGVFRLLLNNSGQERYFTCDSDDSALQWVSMINEAARYAGLQGEILKKNVDVTRLKKELATLENNLKEQKDIMENQSSVHKQIIEELLTVHEEEKDRLNPNTKKTLSDDEEIKIDDWVRAKVVLANKIENVCVGLIKYIGDGPRTDGTIVYGLETTDGTLGPHDGVVDAIRYFHSPKMTGMFVTRDQIMGKVEVFNIGDTIELDNHRTAILRFVGRMKTRQLDKSPAYRYGIELIGAADGNHDGKVGFTRYFKCQPKRGLMVPRSRILRVIQRARDKVRSVVDEEKNEMNPRPFVLLNLLRKDMEKLSGTIILPSARATLSTAFQNLDRVSESLRQHPVTGLPNEMAFQDDLAEQLEKLVVPKNGLGLAVFQLLELLESMTTREAEDSLRKVADVLDMAVSQVATREASNTKLANEMLGFMNRKRKTLNSNDRVSVKISSKKDYMKLYNFCDFTHSFCILKQFPAERFYQEMKDLVEQVEENTKISVVSGACLVKGGETSESFLTRVMARVQKAKEQRAQDFNMEAVSSVI